MGSTETQKREQRNLELAAARDEKATADREAEMEKMGDLVKENTELKKLNTDALDALAALKEQVEKLNVLNAKLLYTNKALVNISLNERQKNNIVESISKADSVLAAKTIYETVQNAVENNKQEREAPQSLRETLNRAATPFVVKKSANNSVNDLMAARMKALAGIK
jgi:predicted nuclease with TOPRIM domain